MALGERVQQLIQNTVVGSGVFIGYGQNTLSIEGTFVAGNDFDLTINGVAIAQVPFNTDHDTTMRDIATSISALATVNAVVISGAPGNISRILINGVTEGLTLTYTLLGITGGATQPSATISDTHGSLQEQPAMLTLSQSLAKIDRIKNAANYSRTFTYAAAYGAPGGENITVIVYTGTTDLGVETVTETITYVDPLVDGQQITSIVYS